VTRINEHNRSVGAIRHAHPNLYCVAGST
jgi:hypothetical protein